MSDKKPTKLDDAYLVEYMQACKEESDQAKINRMALNRDNYEMYQLRHNFAHKIEGQSKEVLSKTRNATEQIKSFFQQSLADLDDWWKITAADNSEGTGMLVRPEEMGKLTNYMLKKADYFSHVGKLVQLGLLGSLSISKVTGYLCPKPKYKVVESKKGKKKEKNVEMIEDEAWELRFCEVRQEDYYPDPRHNPYNFKLYEIEEYEMDMHMLHKLAEDEYANYDKEAINNLSPWPGSTDTQDEKIARETGQNTAIPSIRPRVRIQEFWGHIVCRNTGKILKENCTFTIANEDTVIRRAEENPNWHQQPPYVAAALIEVASSVWGIALMDAGTKHNRSLIEIYNLMVDSSMKAVWGINQIRTEHLTKPEQLSGGIRWGTNIEVDSSLPAGAKVMEPVVTGEIPNDVLNIFNLMTQETLTSMMTNDLRMGAQSARSVKATEVVAAENSLTSVFQGMAKNFESKLVQKELELSWKTIAQNWDLIDKDVFKALFGPERGAALAALDPQDVFVETVNGTQFEVFGISMTLKKQADFRKWTTLLQTIGSSEVLIESFLAKYSFEKFLGEIMTSLDINKTKIENDEVKQAQQEIPGGQEPPAPGGPDQMSQIPSGANTPAGGGAGGDALASAFGAMQMNMPSSQAIK